MMPVTPAVPGVGELVGQFQEQAEAARAANEARYAQGLGIHEELVGGFGQGGTLQTAMMGQYQRQKERDLATQKQHMISSGLMNTTIAAGMPAAYEEQVGTPYKMQMADLMAQRRAGAMQGQAGFIERREDIPPSPELMASLVQTASARPEDVAAGETGAAGRSVSSEIAAGTGTGTGVPSMADVARGRGTGGSGAIPKKFTGTGPTFVTMGGGGWGTNIYDKPYATGGGGSSAVKEPSRGTQTKNAPMTQEAGQNVTSSFMGPGGWIVKLADGRIMSNSQYMKLKRQKDSSGKTNE
jgi:hypothetical protein